MFVCRQPEEVRQTLERRNVLLTQQIIENVWAFSRNENRREILRIKYGLYVVVLALGWVSLQNSELLRTLTVAGVTVESL